MAKKNLHLSRNAYILNIRKNQKYLREDKIKAAVAELKASEGIMQMRKIFDHYKQIALVEYHHLVKELQQNRWI